MPASAASKSKDATAFAVMKPPEELRAASEKLMNFWVGAATPLWFPFMAATSFGIGTWALTQAMQRQQELLKDIPLGGGLGGGLGSFWLAGERASEALAVTEVRLAKEVETAPEALEAAVVAPQAEVAKAATAMMNERIELASKSIESVTAAVETAAKPAKVADPKVEPVKVEIPKVKPAKVASPATATAKAAVKTADKVAEAMSEAPKPASRRRPARKA